MMSDASKTPAPQEENSENVSVKLSSEPLGSQSSEPLPEQPSEVRSQQPAEVARPPSISAETPLPELGSQGESQQPTKSQQAESQPAEPLPELGSQGESQQPKSQQGEPLPELGSQGESQQPGEVARPPTTSAETSPELPDSTAVAEPEESEANESEANESEANESEANEAAQLAEQAVELRRECESLKQEIVQLQAVRGRLAGEQLSELQGTLGSLMQESLSELEKRKQALQISVEQLERRQERIRKEMRTTFAGVSQDLAIRVQGFKDYLAGSLQDLVSSVEELDLLPKEPPPEKPAAREPRGGDRPSKPQFSEQGFQKTTRQIRQLLDRYRNQPDYYGPPWQLRRTFEPIHAERVSNWFFSQGGRGALRTMGSRLQNILIASAIISVLYQLYGKRLHPLILCSTSPERLGEWRRGLQDCLGISRIDFGSERGVVLFEDSEPLAARADRLLQDGLMPLIIIDESEAKISLSILQFPLWLAFAPDPKFRSDY